MKHIYIYTDYTYIYFRTRSISTCSIAAVESAISVLIDESIDVRLMHHYASS